MEVVYISKLDMKQLPTWKWSRKTALYWSKQVTNTSKDFFKQTTQCSLEIKLTIQIKYKRNIGNYSNSFLSWFWSVKGCLKLEIYLSIYSPKTALKKWLKFPVPKRAPARMTYAAAHWVTRASYCLMLLLLLTNTPHFNSIECNP